MRTFNLGHRFPLSWPMSQQQLSSLDETLLVSPRTGNAHGYQPPTEEVYRHEVEQLRQLRQEVELYRWSDWWWEEHLGRTDLSPILAKQLGLRKNQPGQCADTVRMDHPFDIFDIVVEPYIREQGIKPKTPATHPGVPFVESVLLRAQVHSFIASGLNKSFDVKYAFGVCRPIEFYDPSLQRFETPNHPECPAGHGAFSGACAKAFENLWDATPEQIEEVIFATKQFAMFRSLSAMHIPYSNLLGWQIGYDQ